MNAPITQMRKKRENFLLILITAILCALAINLLTSYLSEITKENPLSLLLLGLFFLCCAAFLLSKIIFLAPTEVLRVRGAVAFKVERDTIQPIEITGYRFNDDFCEYLRGFIQENKAYGKLFSKSKSDFAQMQKFDPDDLNYHTIINSVLEFVILHQLDLHLNSYFIENEIDKRRIVTLTRDQVDPSVLKNRVIDLITKDMKERPAFARDANSPSDGIVVYAPGEGGAVFQRLDIELPPECRIYRNSDGFLVISNPLFDLCIKPRFEGFRTNVSEVFTPSASQHFAPLLVIVKIETRIKKTAFISGESMEMYEWLDSFLARIKDYVSTDELEHRLDPNLIKILRS